MPLRRRTLRSRPIVFSLYILIYIRRRARLRTKTVLTTRFFSQLSKLDFGKICCWYISVPSCYFLLLLTSFSTHLHLLISIYTYPYFSLLIVVFLPKALPFCLLLYLDLLPRELRSSLYLLIHLRTRRSALSRGELEGVTPTTRQKFYLSIPHLLSLPIRKNPLRLTAREEIKSIYKFNEYRFCFTFYM